MVTFTYTYLCFFKVLAIVKLNAIHKLFVVFPKYCDTANFVHFKCISLGIIIYSIMSHE